MIPMTRGTIAPVREARRDAGRPAAARAAGAETLTPTPLEELKALLGDLQVDELNVDCLCGVY